MQLFYRRKNSNLTYMLQYLICKNVHAIYTTWIQSDLGENCWEHIWTPNRKFGCVVSSSRKIHFKLRPKRYRTKCFFFKAYQEGCKVSKKKDHKVRKIPNLKTLVVVSIKQSNWKKQENVTRQQISVRNSAAQSKEDQITSLT